MATLIRPHVEPIGPTTAVFIAPVETDPFGDPLPGAGAETEIPGCAFVPRSASEDSFRAATTSTEMMLLAPIYADDLDDGDAKAEHGTMRVDGQVYQIDGDPLPWRHLDGEHAGTQINLRRGGS